MSYDFYRDLWASTTVMKLHLDLTFCHTAVHVGLVPALPLSLASLTGASAEALLRASAEARPHAAALSPTSAYMCMHEGCACIYMHVSGNLTYHDEFTAV